MYSTVMNRKTTHEFSNQMLALIYSSYMILIGVHEVHGRVRPNLILFTIT